MQFQLLENGKPCGYPISNSLQDAMHDLKDQHTRMAYNVATEPISDISDNSFDATFHSGKTKVYTIGEID